MTMIKVLTRLLVTGVAAAYLHAAVPASAEEVTDRKSTRLNSSH